MEIRQRLSHSEGSEYSIATHTPAYPRQSEVLKRQRALHTATQLASPAIVTTLAYFAYRVWCGLTHSGSPNASLAGDAWVKWMFLGVEMGFSRMPFLTNPFSLLCQRLAWPAPSSLGLAGHTTAVVDWLTMKANGFAIKFPTL